MSANATNTSPENDSPVVDIVHVIVGHVIDALTVYSAELKSSNFLCFNPLTPGRDPEDNSPDAVIEKATGTAIHSILKAVYLKNHPSGHYISYSYTINDKTENFNVPLRDCKHNDRCPMIIGHAMFLWYVSKMPNYDPRQAICTGCGFHHDNRTVDEIRSKVNDYLDRYDSPFDPKIGNITATRMNYVMEKIYNYLRILTPEMYDLLGFVPKPLVCINISKNQNTDKVVIDKIRFHIFNNNIFLLRNGTRMHRFPLPNGEYRDYECATHTKIDVINNIPYVELVKSDEYYNSIFWDRQQREHTWSRKHIEENNLFYENFKKPVPPPDFMDYEKFPSFDESYSQTQEDASANDGKKQLPRSETTSNKILSRKDLPDLSIYNDQ